MSDVGWIALSSTGRIGNKTLQALLKQFEGDTAAILRADAKTLQQVPGVGPKIAKYSGRSISNMLNKRFYTGQAGVRVLTMQDHDYPIQLKALEDAPPTLFVRGQSIRIGKSLAIVGTRNPSDEARNFAQNLSTYLVDRGYTIISGLALGIDSAAHFGADYSAGAHGSSARVRGFEHLPGSASAFGRENYAGRGLWSAKSIREMPPALPIWWRATGLSRG